MLNYCKNTMIIEELDAMAISNQTILKKMSAEIQEAMLHHTEDQKLREHVRSVKLLADLLLEEESSHSPTMREESRPTAEEIRKMMGAKPPKQKEEDDNHDGANGSSIFDF